MNGIAAIKTPPRFNSCGHTSTSSGDTGLSNLSVLGAANFVAMSRRQNKCQSGGARLSECRNPEPPSATARSVGTEPQQLGQFYPILSDTAVNTGYLRTPCCTSIACLCGSLAQCALSLKRLSAAGLGSIPRAGRINCFTIIGVHALRLISRTGKRV